MVTDGTDAAAAGGVRDAATAEGALVELVAPQVGGVVTSDGELVPAHQKIDGGPSVLYDAVAILATADGAALLAKDAAAKDFVSDAHAHCKFVGFTPAAQAFLEAVVDIDEGYVKLDGKARSRTFLEQCRTLRHWARTPHVDQT